MPAKDFSKNNKIVRKILVYDYETDGKTPASNPVQLAAVVIDPRKLELVDGAEFNSMIRPPDIDGETYFKDHEETIKWHAQIRNTTVDVVLQSWKDAPGEKQVWNNFVSFAGKFNNNPVKPTGFGAAIPAGYNIVNFDNVISRRLADKYETSVIFSDVFKMDLMDYLYPWLYHNPNVKKFTLDELRDFFGIEKRGGHDALKDTIDTAQILIKYLKLVGNLTPRVQFKDSFKNG